jgi:tetratricopeptide (TPR) repeat protein
VLSQHPNQFDALHLLGLLRHQQNRPAEAVQLIKRALDANPRSLAALADYGLVLQQLGRVQEAVDCLRKAVALAPGNADLAMTLGDALLALGRPDEALQTYDRVLAINPNDGSASFCMKLEGRALSSSTRLMCELAGQKTTIGQKRNRLVERARGKIIAQFDDDDFYSRDYLATMKAAMDESDADIVKCKRAETTPRFYLNRSLGGAISVTKSRTSFLLGSGVSAISRGSNRAVQA